MLVILNFNESSITNILSEKGKRLIQFLNYFTDLEKAI